MLIALPDNFLYFSLYLTGKSKKELLNFVKDNFENVINKADKLYLDHITLLHKNDKRSDVIKFRMYELLNYIFENYVDEVYEVEIVAFGSNNRAAAFKVILPDGFPCFMFKTYHITIATFNGAKPVESNNIINWHELDEPITVTAVLEKVIIEKVYENI